MQSSSRSCIVTC